MSLRVGGYSAFMILTDLRQIWNVSPHIMGIVMRKTPYQCEHCSSDGYCIPCKLFCGPSIKKVT